MAAEIKGRLTSKLRSEDRSQRTEDGNGESEFVIRNSSFRATI